MIKINIIAVGKLKEKYWRDAISEYAKRLSAFCKFEVVELAEYRLSDSPSEKEILQALDNEGKNMQTYIDSKNSYNIAMCIEGKFLSSTDFSEKIENCAVNGFSVINFIIGSSFGISDIIKKQCDFKLSMSEMTFPHQLARVMLSEQIFRAFQIQKNSKYHK